VSDAHLHRFSATIYRVGILRCVDLPAGVAATFAEWDNAPVRVRVGRGEARTRLVPRGEGGLRCFLDGALRKAAGVDSGDRVDVEITLDESADREPFPDDLMAVAEQLEGGIETLLTLPPGLRGQILKFLDGARSDATRRKRLARCRELLIERIAKP
jgi:hypothetical protein